MKKSVITYLVVFALIALMLISALFGLDLGFAKIPSAEDGVKLGLDLVGGSEITYQAVIPSGTSASDVDSGMEAAVTMLRQRLDALGYSEATVLRQGEDQIVVDIPAVSNPEEAATQIGTTAVVEFRTSDYVAPSEDTAAEEASTVEDSASSAEDAAVEEDSSEGSGLMMDGSGIASARAEYSAVDDTGNQAWHVVLEFTAEGQQQFAEITKYAANMASGENTVSIYLDDQLISQPQVSSEYATTGIDSDTAVITLGSDASSDYATYLANIIAAGRLPFTLENVKMDSVGASLGAESLSSSLRGGAIGILLVMIFMIAVYRLPGVIASISLLFYVALFIVVISVAQFNLSLSGIAGIILTIGMAVDANVIIYERIKEELRNGKTVRAAIDAGYHRAMSAIIDSNVTTIIAAVVLWRLGTGTTVGFAKTLFTGVILSMIVMLWISRILMNALVPLGATNPKLYGVNLEKSGNNGKEGA